MSPKIDNDSNALMFSFKTDEEVEKYFEDENEDVNRKQKDGENLEPGNRLIDHIKDEDFTTPEKSLSTRLFGKIEAGSLRGSIFNMIILSLGSGCLSLPKSMSDTSLGMGIISIILTASVTYWTLYILGITCDKYRLFNYSKLTRLLLGNGFGVALDIIIFIYIYGIIVMYQVVGKNLKILILVYTMMGEAIYNMGGFYSEYDSLKQFLVQSIWGETWFKFALRSGIATFIIIPLCLLKDISSLRIVSLLGVFTMFYIIILILIQSPFYINYYWEKVYKSEEPKTHLKLFDFFSCFDKNLFFFQGTATLFYSFTCHLGAFPIFNSLKQNAMKRIHKVIVRTLFIDCFFFLIISVFGYLTWPINTPSLILERDNIFGGADIYMSIGRLALMFIVLAKLPNSYNAFRISILELIYGDSKLTNKR
jgi:amino acid permease